MAEDNVQPGDGAGGTESKPWLEQVGKDLREHESLRDISDVNHLVQTYVGQRDEVSTLKGEMDKHVKLPGENASDDEKNQFYSKMGRPETSGEYQFEDIKWPESLPKSLRELTEGDTKAFRDIFHKAGLTAEQAKTLHKASMDMALGRWEEGEKASNDLTEKSVASLKGDWGNKYDENVELSKRGFQKVGELAGIKDEFVKFMNDSGLGNNPLLVKAFHAIGNAIGNDTALDTDGSVFNAGDKTDVKRDEAGRAILHFPSMEKEK